MKKRKLAAVLLTSTMVLAGSYSNAIEALGRSTDIVLDGDKYSLEAYNIADNNYFKLRDLAKILNNTDKRFNVVWNKEANSVEIETGKEYETVGNELNVSEELNKEDAVKTNSSILYNNEKLEIEAYNIKDNNYFKLRDLTEKLDILTGYDNESKTIKLDSSKSYEKESKPVEKQGLEKIKEEIENGKYKDQAPTTVKAITYIDLDNNGKEHIAALVTDGEAYKLLHLDNTGKFLNAEEIYLEDSEIEMYVVDAHVGEIEDLKRTKELFIKYKNEDFVNFIGFEYHEGKLIEYKLGQQVYSDVKPIDDYKIKVVLSDDEEEINLKGTNITLDVSDNLEIKEKYFDSNGKPLITESNDDNNHLRVEIESLEEYKDEKTGYLGISYTCTVKDIIEEVTIGKIKVTNLAIDKNHKFTYLRSIKVEEIK